MDSVTPGARTKAAQMLAEHKIDALVVIGVVSFPSTVLNY